jgi:membrane protease YdiL (CAAX protease family)
MTVCFGLSLAGLLQSDSVKMTAAHREFAQMALTGLFVQGGILVWIWFFLRETAVSWSEAFGLDSPRRVKAVLVGAAGAALFLPLAVGLQSLLAFLMEWVTGHPAAQQDLVTALEKGNLPLAEQVFVGVLAVMIAPAAEEMLFRGIIYPTIKQGGFPRTAWWATSLLFAGMHFNELSFLPLMAFSMFLIFLYEKTGSLWASITAHSLFNYANFLVLMLSAGEHPLIPAQ